MNIAGRVLAVLFVVPAIFYLVYWLPFAFVPSGNYRWVASIVALGCALACGWYVWRAIGLGGRGVVPTAFLWATVMGAVAFLGGFLGPMLFAPSANQGPMLGIFITGPLGFVAGGVAGAICAVSRNRKQRALGRTSDAA